jgi:predicted  nucleic acid-binding Zn-ribbon protein
MKRIPAVIALTAALSFGVSAHAQTSFADVPAGHWAQEAIARAVDCGIILGYPDGTFRGKQAITRYEAAAMIGRLLDAIKEGKCGLNTGQPGSLDADAIEALQNAVQELSADLADQGVRISELEDNAVTQDDLSRVEELATEARDLAQAAVDNAGSGDTGDAATADDIAALQEQLDALQEQADSAVSPEDFAALQDQVAAIEELAQEARDLAEAAADSGGGDGTDPEALAALTDQVEAAGIAADTALAQSRDLQDSVDALGGRVDDLESQLGELGATVEGQADSIAALNDLVVLLNQDVLSLQDRIAELEGQIEDTNAQLEDINAQLETTASADDLEALREFTTLLRRDQTALADRVSDLEARIGATEKKNADQDARLDVLEANGFTVSGTISLGYYVARVWTGGGAGVVAAPDFDIDRLGLGAFSSGNAKDQKNWEFADFNNGYGLDAAELIADVGDPLSQVDSQNRGGKGAYIEGNISPDFTITLAFKQRNLTEASKGYNSFPLVLTLTGENDGDFGLLGSDNINPINFKITKLDARYLVGAAPLTVNYGVNPSFKFGAYAGNNGDGRGDGFIATADAGFLGLKLTGVYGSKNGNVGTDPKNKNVYVWGVKGEASIIPGLTGGVYYLSEDDDVISNANPATFNGRDILGANASGKAFGFLSLEGEYNVSINRDDAKANMPVAGYAKAGVDLGFVALNGNFRVVSDKWSSDIGLGSDGPYGTNQSGFGVDATLKLGFIGIGGFFDSRNAYVKGTAVGDAPEYKFGGIAFTPISWGSDTASAFGVGAAIRLIGFDVFGGFAASTNTDSTNAAVSVATTDIRVGAKHDGAKDDALIKGLNLSAGFDSFAAVGKGGTFTFAGKGDGVKGTLGSATFTTGVNGSVIHAYGDFAIKSGDLAITPAAYFSSVSATLTDAVGTGNIAASNFGVKLTATVPLGFLKLNGGVAFDSTGFTGKNTAGAAIKLDSSTLWFSVGVSFDQFLLPNSSFGIAFASRTDTNRNGKGLGPSFGSPVGFGSWGADIDKNNLNESGIYATMSYYGLDFKYGYFVLVGSDATGKATNPVLGQAFSMSYKLKF